MLQANCLGKKSGRGFYLHTKGGKTELNPQTDSFRTGNLAGMLTRRDLQERMVLLMVNEAARCLEEQVVARPEDADFGMVMGTGFAPFRGGPLRYADSEGIDKIIAAMRRWVGTGATYFEPCALLQSMASNGEHFYGQKMVVIDFQKSRPPETERGSVTRSDPESPKAPQRTEPRSNQTEDAPELIDTSKMSAGQRAALELTEAARENTAGSFASRMFMGKLDLAGISPFPEQSPQDRDQGDVFLRKLETFLREHVDPDEIDRTGEIPQDVIDGLAKLGAFGIKISQSYSGLGLSQTN